MFTKHDLSGQRFTQEALYSAQYFQAETLAKQLKV